MRHATDHNLTLEERDKRFFFHPSTSISDLLANGPKIMDRAAGVRVTDIDGRSYIDAAGGLWCVNVGYGRQEIVEAITRQASRMAFYHSFSTMSNEPAILLAERVMGMVPEGMARVFFGNSGSDANDTNIKLVWYYNNLRGKPQKKKIISRRRAYHGVSIGGGSATGLPINHDHFDLPLPQFRHARPVDQYREKPEGMDEEGFAAMLAAELEAMIEAEGPDTVAAFIAEPVMGTGGVLVPPRGYFERVRAICDRHDMLLIADEVICGFGRLGSMFGSVHYGFRPDLMTLAKGLSSGYQPISGSVVSERVWQVLEATAHTLPGFGHGYTYSAHPVCAAAALANLDILEREDLTANAARVGPYLRARMQAVLGGEEIVGDIRGEGLMIGVELVADRATKRAFDPALKVGPRTMKAGMARGILCRALPHRDVLAFSPPLILTEAEADEIVAALAGAVAQVRDELMAKGDWRPS